jgi:ubiquinone/menaquinone biosynthesis C-methylase UbiE
MEQKIYTSQRADIETSSNEYVGRFKGEAGEYFLETQKNKTLKLLNKFKGASVLDVGGGHAQIAVPLVENGFKLTVVGSTAECRERLDIQLPPNSFSFKTVDLLNLPFTDESFDIVTAFRLLPHEVNWKIQIHELCRVAKHAVIVDYPDIRSFNIFYSLLFSLKKKVEVNTRQFLTFNRKQITKEFIACGFSQITLEPQFFFPMVVHRALNNKNFSASIENISRILKLTHFFGSPIILMAAKKNNSILNYNFQKK